MTNTELIAIKKFIEGDLELHHTLLEKYSRSDKQEYYHRGRIEALKDIKGIIGLETYKNIKTELEQI